LRYAPGQIRNLADVVCPPYDVISEEERAALARRSALNIVAIELPAAEGTANRYESARRLLDAWRDGGILVREKMPAFYGYRMSYTDDAGAPRRTVGVIGALVLEPPGEGILPHEFTTPKAKTDRLELLRACRANVSPIWVLSATGGLAEACAPPAEASARAADPDGVIHELWPITDPARVALIADLVAGSPVLVADGHHRYEVALAYQQERRAAGDGGGDHDAVMALVVELADDQLSVRAIHRLVQSLPDGVSLPSALDPWFELAPTTPPDAGISARMEAAGALAVVTREGAWMARARPHTERAAEHDLDSSRLGVALHALGVHEVVHQHGWDAASGAVAGGRGVAAILLRPATVAQIAEVGRGGARMPAKTTLFWPKPRTGLVIRELIG
jgi:uncharacterized protein (DUF1015 family)